MDNRNTRLLEAHAIISRKKFSRDEMVRLLDAFMCQFDDFLKICEYPYDFNWKR